MLYIFDFLNGFDFCFSDIYNKFILYNERKKSFDMSFLFVCLFINRFILMLFIF